MNTMPNPADLPLRDIHLPDPISWWPLALGWWFVAAATLLLITLTLFVIYRLVRQSTKKQANKVLKEIEATFQQTNNGAQCIAELSILLRRVVITRNPKSAGVTGKAWLQLLDDPNTQEFSQGLGQILLTAPYQPSVDSEEVSALIKLCRKVVNQL